jgi:hypothetical protein
MLAAMKAEPRSWGVGLILLGMAHFVWSNWLDPTWGGIILVIGHWFS